LPHPTKFRSPPYRALVKTLGESDSVVEWIEVGVRELTSIHANNGINAVEDLAERHNVCVHPIDFIDFRCRCTRLQILAVYQQIEYFLESFRKTHPRQVNYPDKSNVDRLTRTLSAFKVASKCHSGQSPINSSNTVQLKFSFSKVFLRRNNQFKKRFYEYVYPFDNAYGRLKGVSISGFLPSQE